MEQGVDDEQSGGDAVAGEANRVSSSSAYILSRRRRRRPRRAGTRCTIHDNSSQGYGWLLPGWIAEERHMLSGRVYRYYYDPSGRLYYTQNEVIRAWEERGLILLDK